MNFKKIDLPLFENVQTELDNMIYSNTIEFCPNNNQICLNTVEDKTENFLLGVGSLTKDWNNKIVGNNKTYVPLKSKIYKESDFSFLCEQFKKTVFEEMYNCLNQQYILGRVRLMKSKSKTCLSWHTDSFARIHYPVKTQQGCLMIIEDEVVHMPQNTWWYTNTVKYHTAVNASVSDRIHLVATILGER